MQSLTSHTTSVSGGFKVIFSTQHRMFSVMLNVAMREGEGGRGGAIWDNNMHKEQCIGPGHWGQSLVISSVFQCLSTDPLLQAVGEGGRGERGGSKPG